MILIDFCVCLCSEYYLFIDILVFIVEYYSYMLSVFDNGSVSNLVGQNEGFCKILGFVIFEGFSFEEILLVFGEYYCVVCDNLEGDDYVNICVL